MTESCLDLACLHYGMIISLLRPDFQMGRMWCIALSSPDCVSISEIFEWSKDFSRGDGHGRLVGAQLVGASQEKLGGWYWCYRSRVGFPRNIRE